MRCTNKKCSTGVIVNKLNQIIKVIDSRNHEEYSNKTMTREIIRSTFKYSTEYRVQSGYIKPNNLIRRELRNIGDFNIKRQLNDVELIWTLMYVPRKNTSQYYRNVLKTQKSNLSKYSVLSCFPNSRTANIVLYIMYTLMYHDYIMTYNDAV